MRKTTHKHVGLGFVSNQKGITLIALVITIIILLILAGVAINLVVGDNGILNNSKKAKEEHLHAQAKEKLELVLVDLQADKLTKQEYNESEYIDNKLRDNNMKVSENTVIVDGWGFEIDRSVPKISEDIGRISVEELLLSTITNIETKVSSTKIQLNIQIRNPEGATITYKIRKEGQTGELQKIENTTNLECTFSNLESATTYEITVETTNENGKYEKTIKETTKVPTEITSIKLNKTTTMLGLNSQEQLTYTIEPSNVEEQELIWETSDDKIATVENGKIKAVAIGKCTITCKSANGKVTASCEVEVAEIKGIYSVADLKAVSNDLSATYMLMNDIDLTGENWTSIGYPNYFIGIFDGNGYTIKNLNAPLFHNLNNATVQNLKLENVAINKPTEYQQGAIAHIGYGKLIIKNVGVTGNIYSKGIAGGIIGDVLAANGITAENCYVRINLIADTPIKGGLFGTETKSSYDFIVNQCYFSGEIDTNSYKETVGPIVGCYTDTQLLFKINNCYYNSTKYTENVVEGRGIGLQEEQFANANNFTNWDFTNTWIIKDGYPELRIFLKQ